MPYNSHMSHPPRRTIVFAAAALAAALGLGLAARAWHEKEHYAITLAAGELIERDLPRWFIEGLPTIAAHCSVDPDVFKDPDQKALLHAERPEHYYDYEFLAGEELPRLRFEFYRLCDRKGLDPTKVGTLPWAIVEWTQRLTLAFAEYRKWPDQAHTQAKCLVYAGLLAHYAADLVQPLHTTVHFDGRVSEPGARSPGTGIHVKVDNLLRKAAFDHRWLAGAKAEVEVYDDVWAGMWEAFMASHKRVDRVYELEDELPARDEPRITSPAVNDFAVERARAGAVFLASLYKTAWAASAEEEPPFWLDRTKLQSFPYPLEPVRRDR